MSGSAVPDVIFTCHADDRPLWVTTGLTREQLKVRYGAGIVRKMGRPWPMRRPSS
jgi:hypothetical protein